VEFTNLLAFLSQIAYTAHVVLQKLTFHKSHLSMSVVTKRHISLEGQPGSKGTGAAVSHSVRTNSHWTKGHRTKSHQKCHPQTKKNNNLKRISNDNKVNTTNTTTKKITQKSSISCTNLSNITFISY